MASIERTRPFGERQQIAKLDSSIPVEDDLGIQVGGIDLANEFPATTARRQHVQSALVVAPNSDDLDNAILARRHHGGDGRMFGTESCATAGIDADTRVTIAFLGHQRGRHIPKETITHPTRVQHGLSGIDQFIVG